MAYPAPAPIDPGHVRDAFDCGKPGLNEWLARHALASHAGGSARVYVVAGDSGEVVAYYALAAGSVEPSAAPARLARGQPGHRPIPVVILARLAVDVGHQGAGLGRSLLREAMLRSVAAADEIGLRAILVHAKDEDARAWYLRFGFEPSPTDPLHLVLLMKDVKATLGL